MLGLCIECCKKDIAMFDDFAIAWLSKFPTQDGKLDIRIPAFKRLAIIYEKQGRLDEAIEVCETAMGKNLAASHVESFKKREEKLLSKKIKNLSSITS